MNDRAQLMFFSSDCIHQQLSQADWDEANRQLISGTDPDIVYSRCRGWAADYHYENVCMNAELDHLHANQ